MLHIFDIDMLTTLFIGCLVLLVGRFVNRKIPFLNHYHIPVPVTGGIIAAIVITCCYYFAGMQFNFDQNLADKFMLFFFASLGLSADFKKLIAGGKGIMLLLLVAIGMVVIQDVVGPVTAKLLGLDPRFGVIAGSTTLVGGHGTGGAWGQIFENAGLSNAKAMAFACATYGLVAGGILGGPVAQYLIKSKNLVPNVKDEETDSYEDDEKTRPIRVSSVTEGFICLAVTMYIGSCLQKLANHIGFNVGLPTFVWVIFTGIIVRAILTKVFNKELKEVTIDVLGNVFLNLFLAISLLSVQLWEIAGLALPITGVLFIQTVCTILYSIFVCFNVMGRNYDAAIMCAGQMGFSLGATPTAIANMQSVTNHFGPSHKAFLLVPLVGSFFIDIINAFVIKFSIVIF